MPEKISEAPRQGIGRRQLLTAGGATLGLASLSALVPAQAAFAATIGDPWAGHIKSWSWDWASHRGNGYLGGQDYAYNYGDAIFAPAAGTLGAGANGTSRFTLDATIARVLPAAEGESGNTLAAIEFMHQSAYGATGHYDAGYGPIGYVGNTGLGKSGTSGAHLHVHGISTNGSRVDWRKFVSGAGAPTIPQGDDMPTKFTTSRSVPIPLQAMTWAQQDAAAEWPILPYNDSTPTNLSELQPSRSMFVVTGYFYVSNLPAGEFVHVRLGVQTAVGSGGPVSGMGSMTFEGNNTGRARGNYSANATVTQGTQRLVMQAYASVTGVSLDNWGTDILCW